MRQCLFRPPWRCAIRTVLLTIAKEKLSFRKMYGRIIVRLLPTYRCFYSTDASKSDTGTAIFSIFFLITDRGNVILAIDVPIVKVCRQSSSSVIVYVARKRDGWARLHCSEQSHAFLT